MKVDLVELRRLALAATPGQWHPDLKDIPWLSAIRTADPLCKILGVRNSPDAAYVAAAHPAVVLALLDHLAAAEAALATTETMLATTETALDNLQRYTRHDTACSYGSFGACDCGYAYWHCRAEDALRACQPSTSEATEDASDAK